MPSRKPPFKMICMDDHAFIFESREKLLAARKRQMAGLRRGAIVSRSL
jgi:hypothetical protein